MTAMTNSKKTENKSQSSALRMKVVQTLCSIAIAVGLIGAAEYYTRTGAISPLIMVPPSVILQVTIERFQSGLYVGHLVSSIWSMLLGFGSATVIAGAFAGLLASVPFMERVMTPFIVAFQSMPKVALAPLILLWFGFGDVAKVVIIISVCFFPIMVNTLQGLKVRDRDHYELMRSLGATRWQLYWHLRLPHALPYIFAGLQIGAIFALLGTVVAEFVGTNAGIGYALLESKAAFDVPGVYSALLILMVIGLTLHMLMKLIEQRVAFWTKDLSSNN